MAITYNFSDSGVSPALSGCSHTGAGTYTCTNAVTLTGNDSITISGTTPATITFNSNLTLQFLNETTSAKINSGGSAANLNLIVNGTLAIGKKVIIMANIQGGSVSDTGGDVVFGGSINTTTGAVRLDYNSAVAGSITTTSGAITLNDRDTVGGSVTSTSGGINFTNKSTISGNVSCSTCTFTLTGLSSTIQGTTTVGILNDFSSLSSPGTIYNNAITALTGDATIGYYATVNGNITAKRNIQIRNFANVTGNITTNNVSGDTLINILDDATVNGNISATASGIYNTYVYVNERITINGSITTYTPDLSEVRIYTTSTVNGDITAFGGDSSTVFIWGTVVGNVKSTATDVNDGNLYLYANSTVNGSVYVSSNIFNYGTVTGCAQTTDTSSGQHVYLYSGSSTNATCSGTTTCSTNTSYVFKASSITMPPICSFNATKIASYSLDELSWNGTANEVKDTASFTGGPFDGQGKGSPVPTSNTIAPARAGTTGTCGYATFSGSTNGGSAFTLDDLPVSTALGELTSVSFWMYWDGTNFVQPIGWNLYNLFFSDGNFGFNTGAYDIWGVSSAGLANGWHHVAAVFANGNVANSKLYINGVQRTLVQTRSVDVVNANAYVQSTLDISGWTLDNSWRFTGGRIDEVRVYRGAMTQAQVTADFNETHLCPVYNVVPSNFNCVVVGDDASAGKLYTQVAGSAFSVDIVALKSTGAVETNYVASGTKSVTLEFVDGAGATACGSRVALNPAVSQTVTFASTDLGRKTVSNINISRAYRDLRCRVTDANQSPSVVGCSSDNFAVRPASFTVTSSNANADNAGANTTATPAIKAGASFNLSANAGVLGYDGTPIIDTSKINAHAGAVQIGNVSGLFSAANATTGIATGASFNYSEVGYFNFAANGVYDSSFTSVDAGAGDCVAGFTSSGGKYGCSFGNTSASNYYGRFIPDHFSITAGANTEGCDSGNFTYYGQDGLSTGFTLRAENSTNAITQNYVGSFAKLGLTNWSNYNFTSQGSPYSPELSASATTPTGTWVSGTASITAKHQISRLSAMVPQSPKCADEYNFCSFSGTRTVIYGLNGFYTSGTFTNGVSCSNSVFGDPLFGTVKACYLANLPSPSTITVFARPTDSDGVTISSTAVSAASLFRYGRLLMPNVYGSELLPLSTTIEAQYWNGNVYQRNQQDSCSVIPTNSIAMGNYRNNLTACETQLSGAGTLNAGKTTANLTKPGAGNNGSVDLTINLNGASGSTCNSATASSAGNANMPWFGNNPNARATFGIFKTPVIYMRENF